MNTKLIAVIVAAVIVVGGIAVYFAFNQDKTSGVKYDDKAINAIGRMNNDGSGMFIDSDLLSPDEIIPTNVVTGIPFFTLLEDGSYAVSEENKGAWGGLVFSDPEIHSIQHAQLVGIAKAIGLKVQEYTDGTQKKDDTLYYISDLYTFDLIIGNDSIDGGIIWEPVHQRLISDGEDTGYAELSPTKRIFDWHICSIIGANHNWLEKNRDAVTKFLAAYSEATDIVNEIIKEGGSRYEAMIESILEKAPGFTEEEIKNALNNTTFLCADDDKGSLSILEKDVTRLGNYLKEVGMVTSDKFKDPKAFAKAFVDSGCMKDAYAGKASKEGQVTIRLPEINLSTAFLPLTTGEQLGLFEKYGITLEYVKGEYTAGDDVVKYLMEGKIDIGFFGAPPPMEAMINGEHIIV